MLDKPTNSMISQTPKDGFGLRSYDHYINGEASGPETGAYFESMDPVSGEVWAKIARGDASDVDRACQAAQTAFEDPEWRHMSQSGRGKLLRRLGDLILENADWLASVEMKDNGKLIAGLGGRVEAQNLDRNRWTGFPRVVPVVVDEGAHAPPCRSGNDEIADAKRAPLHQHSANRTAAAL